jgi:hypothetical protein
MHAHTNTILFVRTVFCDGQTRPLILRRNIISLPVSANSPNLRGLEEWTMHDITHIWWTTSRCARKFQTIRITNVKHNSFIESEGYMFRPQTVIIRPDDDRLSLKHVHVAFTFNKTVVVNLSRNTNKMSRHSTLFPALSISTCFGHVPCPSSGDQ